MLALLIFSVTSATATWDRVYSDYNPSYYHCSPVLRYHESPSGYGYGTSKYTSYYRPYGYSRFGMHPYPPITHSYHQRYHKKFKFTYEPTAENTSSLKSEGSPAQHESTTATYHHAEDEDLWSHLSTATSTYEEKATTYDSFMIEKLAKMARKQPEKLSITSSSQYEPELAPISPSPRLSSTPYTYSNPSSIGYGRTMDYGLMGYGRNSPFMDYGSSYGERSMGYGRNNFGGLGFGTGGLFGISSGIGVTAPFVGPIGVGSGLTIG